MNSNEKNPVPSIDFNYLHKKVKEFAKSEWCNTRDRYLSCHAFLRWLEQNGVETTKEHPNTELLKEALYTLNNIPNHENVGMNNETSYEVMSSIEKRMVG